MKFSMETHASLTLFSLSNVVLLHCILSKQCSSSSCGIVSSTHVPVLLAAWFVRVYNPNLKHFETSGHSSHAFIPSS